MSEDWFVRSDSQLDLNVMVAGAADVVPNLRVRGDDTESWVVLAGQDNRPRVWVSPSRPSGSNDYEHRVEVSGMSGAAVAPFRTTERMVREIAEALAGAMGGEAVRLSAATVAPDDIRATEDQRLAPVPSNLPDAPFDRVTGRICMLVQTRPVVTVTSLIRCAVIWSMQHQRRLVVVTPAACVLSTSASLLLRDANAQWVVDTGETLYDGFTGRELQWGGEEFVEVKRAEPAAKFLPDPGDGWALVAQAQTTHPYADATQVGGFTADVCRILKVGEPTLFGNEEPLAFGYDLALLTEVARDTSPEPTRFAVAGPVINGSLEMVPQPSGLVESIDLVAESGESEAVRDWTAAGLAMLSAGAQFCSVQFRRRPPRVRAPRADGPGVPGVVVWAKGRYPTLSDAEVERVGGPHVRMVNDPVPGVIVTFDSPRNGPGSEERSVAQMARLVELQALLVQHDQHRLLAE